MSLPVGPTAKRGAPREETPMTNQHRLTMVLVACFSFFFLATSGGKVNAQGQPEGQLTIAFDASIASSFLDPAETSGLGTPFVFLYALHDALMKPLPGNDMAPCLAESWRESSDGLAYEFKLREGLRFHNGDPFTPAPPFTSFGEAVANYLTAIGIRSRVRSMERATFFEAWRTKKLTGIIMGASAGLGNAAARLEAFVISSGTYAYGGYPDIDDLFRQQGQERDRRKRETMLHQIQRLMHERVMHAPIFEPATLHGIGPRVEEPAVGLNSLLYFAAPYEEMRLKKP